MKNLIRIFFLVALFGFYDIDAQQVVKRDTLGGTELIMSMDSKVDAALESLENKCAKVVSNTTSKITDTESDYPKTPRINLSKRELSNTEICRKNPKILGYKIQITTVKSNDEASEVRSYFRKRFPDLKVEMDASLRPNYKILVGSYFTKQSAASDLSKIKEYFKSAVAVQYRIFCAEAK